MTTQIRLRPRGEAQRVRDAHALELRVAGLTFEAIGRNLTPPISDVAARSCVARALRHVEAPNANAYRALTIQRLEKLLQAHWAPALQTTARTPDGRAVTLSPQARDTALRHAEFARRIIADEREMLGLDEPEKIELTHVERVNLVAMILGVPPASVEAAVAEAEAATRRLQLAPVAGGQAAG